MDGPMEGIDYNYDLIGNVTAILAEYKAANPDVDIIEVKADYLAERSIEDNIKLESS